MRVVDDRLTKSGILLSDRFGVFTVIEFSENTGKTQTEILRLSRKFISRDHKAGRN